MRSATPTQIAAMWIRRFSNTFIAVLMVALACLRAPQPPIAPLGFVRRSFLKAVSAGATCGGPLAPPLAQ